MKIQALVSSLVIASGILTSQRAHAFDYREHHVISSQAIGLAIDESSLARAPNTQTASQAQPVKPLFLEAVRFLRGQGGTAVCMDATVFDSEPKDCLSLGDVPALMGDHAASPTLLKWRWFNGCASSGRITPMDVARMAGSLWRHESPTNTAATGITKPGDVNRLLAAVRVGSAPSDAALLSADPGYVWEAERGTNHFRPGPVPASHEAIASRWCSPDAKCSPSTNGEYSNPGPESFAWYSDLHLGALAFAQRAAAESDPDARAAYSGLAILFELDSLHFLEDGVAAGHMVADVSGSYFNLNLGHIHDAANSGGVDVELSEQVCAEASKSELRTSRFPTLVGLCQAGTKTVRIFGDHTLRAVGGDSRSAATGEWAVLVAAVSLEEVVSQIQGGKPALPIDSTANCLTTLTTAPSGPKWTWDKAHGACDSDQAFYRCSVQWWMTADASQRAASIRRAFDSHDGYFDALRLLPVPTGL